MNKIYFLFFICLINYSFSLGNDKFYITNSSESVLNNASFNSVPGPGDTIFIDTSRKKGIVFEGIEGNENLPVIVTNINGTVEITDSSSWAALQFKNCKFIKLEGRGNDQSKYGFVLSAKTTGIGVTELSTNFEISHVYINHHGFSGIQIKKDYHRNPPDPIPVFNKLVIHNCLIKNVEEGMYLGETVSPGMEFRHVRIFNNITYQTQREGIQVANMVEDVEVHHNLIINSGRAHLNMHGNGIQIGDNTIGSFHHNVISGATNFGFIVFGSGDIFINDNYISNNLGIFIDNRTVSLPFSQIILENNFYREIDGDYIHKIYNSENEIIIRDNHWFNTNDFAIYKGNSNHLYTEENNSYHYFEPLIIENLSITENNPDEYLKYGPQKESEIISFNYAPTIELKDNHIIEWETTDTLTINAKTEDNDGVSFELKDSIGFTSLREVGDGSAQLILNPKIADKGIYTSTVLIKDNSHQQKSRKQIKIAVKDPNNHSPSIQIPQNISFLNLQYNELSISLSDADNDSIYLTFKNFPEFLKVKQNDINVLSGQAVMQSFPLQITGKPRYIDSGTFNSIKILVNDGYGEKDSAIFNLLVQQKNIENNLVIYRINCGGPEVEDEHLNWEDSFQHKLIYQKSQMHNTGSHFWNGINNTEVPDNIFGPFCYTNNCEEAMQWEFECPNGVYEVTLCFIERQKDFNENNLAVFNLVLNDSLILDNYSIFDENGLSPVAKKFDIQVSNQKINMRIESVENNPKINGIEIKLLNLAQSTNAVIPKDYSDKIFLFPNPSNKEITVKNFGSKTISNAEIFSINGKKINSFLSKNGKNLSINFTKEIAGIYIIRIGFKDGTFNCSKVRIN